MTDWLAGGMDGSRGGGNGLEGYTKGKVGGRKVQEPTKFVTFLKYVSIGSSTTPSGYSCLHFGLVTKGPDGATDKFCKFVTQKCKKKDGKMLRNILHFITPP